MGNLKKIREQKAATQGRCCWYCGHPTWADDSGEFATRHRMTIREAERFKQTAEHLVAKCDGGQDTEANIVMACHYCNSRRHRMRKPLSPSKYKLRVHARLAAGRWHGRSPP